MATVAEQAMIVEKKLYLEKGSRQVRFIDPYEKGMLIVTPDDCRWVGV